MNTHQISPINLLYYREQTSINKLYTFLEREIAAKLQQEAIANHLLITGPVCWTYLGFMGDETEPFTLEVGIPVNKIPEEYQGEFQFKTTSLFNCVSTMHFGDWMQLPVTYGKLMAYLNTQGLTPTGENRELYINANFDQPDANITWVQIGVK